MTQTQTSQVTDLNRFLARFNYSLVTVSVQPEAGVEGAKVPTTMHFSPVNRVRAFTPEQLLTEEVQAELQKAQTQGCAIYFTVNEGDGKPDPDAKEGNLNCGKRKNIKVLRAFCIDTDDADIAALSKALESISLKAHLIIESSPGRAHLYFLIKPTKAEGEALFQWKAVQKKLASLVPGLDQSMHDINQVLRLPTFFNLKPGREPHKVRYLRGSDHEVYDLKFTHDRIGAYEFSDLSAPTNGAYSVEYNGVMTNGNGVMNGNITSLNGAKPYTPFTFPDTPQSLPAGNRRTTICSYIEHVMENVLPLTAPVEDYFTLVDAFIIKYCRPADAAEFLPGGKRRTNIEQYFNDQRNYRIRKHQAMDAAQAAKEFAHVEAVEHQSLPDSFYLSFPGDLGFLTREIHAYAPNLALELCFAGALAISGALKAESFRFKGSWPLVNGIIVAGTGAGKSTIKHVIERALTEAGLRGRYPQLIGFQNTVQSLHTSLYAAGGVGTTLIDEGGDYLKTITARNAPSYATALRKYFKEATTGRDKGTWLHPGGSLSFTVPPIDGGFLSIWMFIQPDKFAGSLSLEDMADGFLPRFFVFNGTSDIKLTRVTLDEEGAASFSPSLDLKVWMEGLLQLTSFSNDTQLTDALDTVETQLRAQNARIKVDAIRAAQRDEVYRLRSEARNLQRKVSVTIDDDAKGCLLEYLKERERVAQALQKSDPNAPALGVYIRMEEMLLRLICNAVSITNHAKLEARVNLELAEACVALHRFKVESFFRRELSELEKGEEGRNLESVLQTVAKAVRKKGEPVTVKDVMQTYKSTQRPRNLSAVLKELVSRGELWLQEREHGRVQGKKVQVYMPALSEDDLV